MKNFENYFYEDSIFVPYDDEKLEHTSNGPDYGHYDSGSKLLAWTELESCEYDDFVFDIRSKIIESPFLKITNL